MVINQFFFFLFLMASPAFANVVLLGRNVTLSFEDIEANFGEFLTQSSYSFCCYFFFFLIKF